MKQLILLATVVVLLSSCTGESETTYDAFWKNTTDRSITVLVYKAGFVQSSDTVRIAPGAQVQTATGDHPGINGQYGFISELLGDSPDDSLVAIFDGRYPVTHYHNMPQKVSSKYLPRSSDRNLYNGAKAYEYSYEDRKKTHRHQTYVYVFSSTDYDYAKQ